MMAQAHVCARIHARMCACGATAQCAHLTSGGDAARAHRRRCKAYRRRGHPQSGARRRAADEAARISAAVVGASWLVLVETNLRARERYGGVGSGCQCVVEARHCVQQHLLVSARSGGAGRRRTRAASSDGAGRGCARTLQTPSHSQHRRAWQGCKVLPIRTAAACSTACARRRRLPGSRRRRKLAARWRAHERRPAQQRLPDRPAHALRPRARAPSVLFGQAR